MSILQKKKKTKRFELDMTTGPLLPRIIMFALPLMLSGILQLLYNAADVIVVGRFAGAQALAAVSSTGSLVNLLVNVFMGLSVGASVVVARAYGAGDYRGISDGVHTSIAVGGIGGILVAILGVFACRPLLEMMGSPDDVIDSATLYLRIFFLGMPANMLYNFGSSILRAVGDTKRPLYYLTVSGIVNVLLNLLLVIVFRMSVAGVAIATVTSQVISAVLVITCLMRSDGAIHFDVRKLRICRPQMLEILRVGLPAGVQGSLFSISNVLIQSSINSFNSIAMAGNGAASNLEGFVYTAMNSIYQADLTFASQNLGAHKYDRIRKGLWVCLGTVAVIGFGLGMVFQMAGPVLLRLYNTDPEVIAYGMQRMGYMMPLYFLCGMMDTLVGQLRGVGYSFMPMIVSLTGACLFRVVWVLTVFAAYHTLPVLYISYPISWGLTAAIHLTTWMVVGRKKLNRLEKEWQALQPAA